MDGSFGRYGLYVDGSGMVEKNCTNLSTCRTAFVVVCVCVDMCCCVRE